MVSESGSALITSTCARLLPDTDLEEARRILQAVFGYSDFRPGQGDVIAPILSGRDVLAILPTGAGKSLCYQIPALLRDGLTVVISPLIALMRDQVRALRESGVEAGALTSLNEPEETERVFDAIDAGRLKLLYLAPERLTRSGTIDLLRRAGVSMVAVDEAHCVSQWGHDFRPDYLEIGRLHQTLGKVQLTAFTATADAETRTEICERLFPGTSPDIFVQGFDRPNISLAFAPKDRPRDQILRFAKARKGRSGIIYCASRAKTEGLAKAMTEQGLTALAYHAGLDPDDRRLAETRFQREDGLIVCATIAFGMGIDKPDIRYVAHADLPKSVEAYYQEIGRAGRDGDPAEAFTLYGLDDIRLRRAQIDESLGDQARRLADHDRLARLLALAEASECRRMTLLSYFGEDTKPCGNCDLCLSPPERFDATEAVRKALSAVLRTEERFGGDHVIAVLRGEMTDKVRQRGHDKLPTFGVGRDIDRPTWRALLLQLSALGYLKSDASRGHALRMEEKARPILRGEAEISLRKPTLTVGGAMTRTPKAIVAEEDEPLLARLKALRRSLAEQRRAPAYVIFNDRTLIAMATQKPATRDQLYRIPGVGEQKLARYGDAFLEVLTDAPATPDHPARSGLTGRPEAELFDAISNAAQALLRGIDGTGKPLHLKPGLIQTIAQHCPASHDDLAKIKGMDERRIARFGDMIVDLVTRHAAR